MDFIKKAVLVKGEGKKMAEPKAAEGKPETKK